MSRKKLFEAIYYGDLEKVKLLVENGADIEAKTIESKTKCGYTALLEAAHLNHLDIVKYLVKKGANINANSIYGNTALHVAINKNNLEIVKFLVENGIDIETKNCFMETALEMAINDKKTVVVEFLEDVKLGQKKFKEEKNMSEQELFKVIRINDIETVKELIEGGVNVNARDIDNNPALIKAMSCNNLEMIELLVQNKANIEIVDDYGMTLLHIACKYGANLKIIKYLVEAGVSVYATNYMNETPLDIAKRCERLEIIQYLESIELAKPMLSIINEKLDILINDPEYREEVVSSLTNMLSETNFELSSACCELSLIKILKEFMKVNYQARHEVNAYFFRKKMTQTLTTEDFLNRIFSSPNHKSINSLINYIFSREEVIEIIISSCNGGKNFKQAILDRTKNKNDLHGFIKNHYFEMLEHSARQGGNKPRLVFDYEKEEYVEVSQEELINGVKKC